MRTVPHAACSFSFLNYFQNNCPFVNRQLNGEILHVYIVPFLKEITVVYMTLA